MHKSHWLQDFLTELYRCFDSPVSRLQLLILLSIYTSQSDFPDHAEVLASHPLMTSLLHCLVFDTSSTACTIALTTLIKLLPIFAVKACEQLKRLLPLLLVVLARIICWKERRSPESVPPIIPEPDDSEEEDAGASDTEDDANVNSTHSLPIREDLGWNALELTFDGPQSKAHSAHRYFTFLYYLFPCNTIRFLRYPIKYLDDNGLESLYAVDWEKALDEDKIRSKSEVSRAAISLGYNEPTSHDVCIATLALAHAASTAHLARGDGGTGTAGFLGEI